MSSFITKIPYFQWKSSRYCVSNLWRFNFQFLFRFRDWYLSFGSETDSDSSQAQSNIPTLLYSPWEKDWCQKSEVLNLRCINVCQYCKYYLKYWSKGINGPLDPWGGQNFQCFIKWDGLTGRGGVHWRAQINFLSKTSTLNPSVHPPRVKWDHLTL